MQFRLKSYSPALISNASPLQSKPSTSVSQLRLLSAYTLWVVFEAT